MSPTRKLFHVVPCVRPCVRACKRAFWLRSGIGSQKGLPLFSLFPWGRRAFPFPFRGRRLFPFPFPPPSKPPIQLELGLLVFPKKCFYLNPRSLTILGGSKNLALSIFQKFCRAHDSQGVAQICTFQISFLSQDSPISFWKIQGDFLAVYF